jgi:hypothetical protein
MYVSLYPVESQALAELAQRERRHPREQAALFIRRGLELSGLLAEAERQAHAEADAERQREAQNAQN